MKEDLPFESYRIRQSKISTLIANLTMFIIYTNFLCFYSLPYYAFLHYLNIPSFIYKRFPPPLEKTLQRNAILVNISNPAEGRTFLRTLGAQRASVRPCVHQKKAFFKWLPIEKYKEIERVCVP